MTSPQPRVAVLARPGEACDRIHGALREAGADVVLVADPVESDPSLVRAVVCDDPAQGDIAAKLLADAELIAVALPCL